QGGDWGKYSGVLDGSDPSLLWTRTFAWSELPRAIDPPGGFVANSNNPPWSSTFPQTPTNDPAKFPAYVAPQFMELRAQNGAGILLGLLKSGKRLTFADVLSGKESTHMLLADRVLADLILAAKLSGNPIAKQAAGTLEAWDRNADATSQGAVLFEAWLAIVSFDPALAKDNTINFTFPHPKFRVGWSASDPLDTPFGLDLSKPAAAVATVTDLIIAAGQVAATTCAKPPCPLDVAWGDVHKIVLATHDPTFQTTIPLSNDPQSGADDPFGPLRVIFRFQPDPNILHFLADSGDGYVQVVEFAKEGARAQALLGYGNASRPGSIHVTDQLPFFEAKALRPTYRTRDEVERHTVLREVVN
ncbi:MAG: penicillin acylase family protein, partial [Methylocella sp.]